MADRGWGVGGGWDAGLPLAPPTEWGPTREWSADERATRPTGSGPGTGPPTGGRRRRGLVVALVVAVSYTHLTLPTILRV